jgi:NAD(P)-dependent dehydrogenase (short-subunit alcohol dehydrogenase family)
VAVPLAASTVEETTVADDFADKTALITGAGRGIGAIWDVSLTAVSVAEQTAELAGDGDRVDQRPVQVERQYLTAARRACRVTRRASHQRPPRGAR